MRHGKLTIAVALSVAISAAPVAPLGAQTATDPAPQMSVDVISQGTAGAGGHSVFVPVMLLMMTIAVLAGGSGMPITK